MSRLKSLRIISVFCLYFILPLPSYSQEDNSTYYKEIEDSLKTFFKSLKESGQDDVKKKYNQKILSLLRGILEEEATFTFPFDSLKNMGKVTSPDGMIRIYSWNLDYSNGSYEFFSFIQYRDEKKKIFRLYTLEDRTELSATDLKAVLDEDQWYGCLYYEIIPFLYKRKTHYALLGWAGKDDLTQYKIIDVLSFPKKGEFLLGADVFTIGKKVQKRVVFEYNAKGTMKLQYDPLTQMIMYDHLVPFKPSYKGIPRYYGADGTYEGMILKKDKWYHVDNADAKNPK